jgi:hypothetical protein
MKFTLKIELGNDAMRSAADVFEAINSHGSTDPSPFEGGEGGAIFDLNGNRVGSWKVTKR